MCVAYRISRHNDAHRFHMVRVGLGHPLANRIHWILHMGDMDPQTFQEEEHPLSEARAVPRKQQNLYPQQKQGILPQLYRQDIPRAQGLPLWRNICLHAAHYTTSRP